MVVGTNAFVALKKFLDRHMGRQGMEAYGSRTGRGDGFYPGII